jgi:Thioredoxin
MSVFDDAASELANDEHISMAAINCYDWTEVCQKVNVSTYPTLLVYNGMSDQPVQYRGMLSKKAVIGAMKL